LGLRGAAGAKLDEIEDFFDKILEDRAIRAGAGEDPTNLLPEAGEPLPRRLSGVEQVCDRDDDLSGGSSGRGGRSGSGDVGRAGQKLIEGRTPKPQCGY